MWVSHDNGDIYSWDGTSWTGRGDPGVAGGNVSCIQAVNGGVWCCAIDTGDLEIFEYDSGTTWDSLGMAAENADISQISNMQHGGSDAENSCYFVYEYEDNRYRVIRVKKEVNANKIAITFAPYTNSDLQPCQQEYTYMADDANTIEDSDTNTHPGRRIK
jgi:hypothetical protein